MHDDDCSCELCSEHTEDQRTAALHKLAHAVILLEQHAGVPSDLAKEYAEAKVGLVDAGLPKAVPVVIFNSQGPLARLKVGFTYDFILENEVGEIANSVHDRVVQFCAEQS